MLAIDQLVQKHAESTYQLVRAKVPTAGHEDEVRVEATKGIDAFIDEARLDVTSRHEYGLGGGRIDSKYGFVAIEYKYPALNDSPVKKQAQAIKKSWSNFGQGSPISRNMNT
jgi:hypothetical protein